MAPQRFEVVLDRPLGCYYPGQTVTGKVLLLLNQVIKMRGIYLELQGKARVHWKEMQSSRAGTRRHREVIHYCGSEDFFQSSVMLYGSGQSSELAPGEHSFPFTFVLPSRLPSSFEGTLGFVRYTVKARIDRPWAFDHEAKLAFTVNSIVDLNRDPTARLGLSGETNKYLCCMCCRSGPITVSAQLEKSGFVPGEAIKFKVLIVNQSNRGIDSIKAELQQHVLFRAHRHTRTDLRLVAVMKMEGIPAGATQRWENESLPVPPLPPTHLGGCRVIDVLYTFDLIVDPKGPARDLALSFPIVVGTIPISDIFPLLRQTSTDTVTDVAPITTWNNLAVPVSEYPELPPPSYEECVFGARSIREEGESDAISGILQYAPRYPTYVPSP